LKEKMAPVACLEQDFHIFYYASMRQKKIVGSKGKKLNPGP